MVVARYPLSQTASCQTMKIIWQNCKNNILPMSAFKSAYTVALCDQRILEIETARALPDEAARSMEHEMARTELVTAGKECTRIWKSLKLYINGVYKEDDVRRIQYKGAGWEWYEDATSESWNSVNSLMQSGSNYIGDNTVILNGENDDNMPAIFPAAFNGAWSIFTTKWTAFKDTIDESKTGAADKVTAINDCYKNTIDMGADGQHVFENDEELRKLFSFESVGEFVEPAGPASFEVTVEVNGVAKPGAEVSILNTDKEMVTNAEGKVLFLQMHEGDLQCRVQFDGYAEQVVTATLTAGVRKRVTVTLQPLFMGEMNVGTEKTEAAKPGVTLQGQ